MFDICYASGEVEPDGKINESGSNIQGENLETLQDIPLIVDREIFVYPQIDDERGQRHIHIAKAVLEENIRNKKIVAIRLKVIDSDAFEKEGGEKKLIEDLKVDLGKSNIYEMDDNIKIIREEMVR